MKTTYEARVTGLTVLPKDEPVFGEMATLLTIDDEAGGEFVIVSQPGMAGMGKIAIDPSEWPVLREAVDRLIGNCRSDQ